MSKAKLTSLLFLGFIGRIAETLTVYPWIVRDQDADLE